MANILAWLALNYYITVFSVSTKFRTYDAWTVFYDDHPAVVVASW